MTKAIASTALAVAVFAGFSGSASAQTREHVLLARQVGVTENANRDNDCWDWTNEDGTHGTNCPAPSGGGGGWHGGAGKVSYSDFH